MQSDLGDVAVAYDLTGSPTSPLVVLSHCFAADRHFWDAQMPALSDFRVLRYDVRGHGESTVAPPPYSLDLLADDVIRLLDALGMEQMHFCGISMSGMIGQNLGFRHADRLQSLALINTTSAYSDADRAAWVERIADVQRAGVAPLRDALLMRWFTPLSLKRDAPAVRYMSQRCMAFDPRGFVGAAEAIRNVAYGDRLHEITVPTLLLAGAEDQATPVWMSEILSERIHRAERHVIPDAGHLSPIEQPDAVNDLLLAFLTRVAPAQQT